MDTNDSPEYNPANNLPKTKKNWFNQRNKSTPTPKPIINDLDLLENRPVPMNLLSFSTDLFAQKVANYQDHELKKPPKYLKWNFNFLGQLYSQIPGIGTPTKQQLYNRARFQTRNAYFPILVARYRKVLQRSKVGLLAEREQLTDKLETRFDAQKSAVRANDMLTAYRDREVAYGYTGTPAVDARTINVVLSSERLKGVLPADDSASEAVILDESDRGNSPVKGSE